MIEFIPKISCSYCDLEMIIDNEAYYLSSQPDHYCVYLSHKLYQDYKWTFHEFPSKTPEFIVAHVACPKCVHEQLDYDDDGDLTFEAKLGLFREYFGFEEKDSLNDNSA